jgi:hypothetical protein
MKTIMEEVVQCKDREGLTVFILSVAVLLEDRLILRYKCYRRS